MIGQKLLHYEIVEKLGEGGMGVVYKARDTHLDRFVAIKVLPPEKVADPERKRRFVQEAKAASALNHPNIVVVHDIASDGGVDFIVMEYIAGDTLDRLIGDHGLPLAQSLGCATEIAGALAKAHAARIIHRDIKPGNVMVNADGTAKLLDFGVAKLKEAAGGGAAGVTRTLAYATKEGALVGTLAYMSPEQLEGRDVDQRSDIFSFGSMFYEMLTGRRAFRTNSVAGTISAVLRDQPESVRKVRPEVTPELDRILTRCLEKSRERRYPDAAALAADLAACRRSIEPRGRPRYALALAAAAVLILATVAAWLWAKDFRIRRTRERTLPEIAKLYENRATFRAFQLLQQAERLIPDDPTLKALREEVSVLVSVNSQPPGVDVEIQDYVDPGDRWTPLGKTPLKDVRLPRCWLRWRLTKPGFEVSHEARNPVGTTVFSLASKGSVPEGMVRADPPNSPTNNLPFSTARIVAVPPFFIDRLEVTNRQFQQFVDAGGYTSPRYWKQPFVKEDRTISWEEAQREFRDATGRPGPSTWEGGRYATGKDDFPVSGVSWYEAAAYAEFAGKSLPPAVYWLRAVGLNAAAQIADRSNFGSTGLVAAGATQGMNLFGSFDMAGNVKEWCWNSSHGQRFILGGAWNEPKYSLSHPEPLSPFDRGAANGFRCIKHIHPPAEAHLAPLEAPFRDYSKEQPVSDTVFKAYAAMYAYDKTDLNARVESTDTGSPFWRLEKITFDAAYGRERVPAYLYLPRNAAPPYQVVVYSPGREAMESVERSPTAYYQGRDWVIKSGRAMLCPVYWGTWERSRPGSGGGLGPTALRTGLIRWYQDLARSLDYLETRNDVDHRRIAYLGGSMGAMVGPFYLALEHRIRVGVLIGGGFVAAPGTAPEVTAVNFAPRVLQPVLMLNGRYDHIFPVEFTQKPLFRLLGTAEKDKRHVVVDSGHTLDRRDQIAATLEWLDRYLGPVKGAPR